MRRLYKEGNTCVCEQFDYRTGYWQAMLFSQVQAGYMCLRAWPVTH
jgi:hypothetical protein